MFWYEDEIRYLENRLTTLPPEPDRVVFYGSSSIRLWSTLAQDFPDINVLNLGFGGSTLAACTWFFERLLPPANPQAIVLYAGDNDLGDGRHPEEVALFFRAFADKMWQFLPTVPVVLLSIKISPVRQHLTDQIRATNQLLSQAINLLPNGQFIDTTTPLLNASQQPDAAFFEPDGLHLSPAGYRAWRATLEAPLHNLTISLCSKPT